MADDNKIRPNKGAMWYMQMQCDYFDLDFNNTFSGMVSTAFGFVGFIKSYIASQYDKKVRSTQIKIKVNILLATIDDERFSTLDDVIDISKKLMTLKKLDHFEVSEDKKFVSFRIDKMLKWLDIHSKNAMKKEIRFEQLRACADELGIPEVSINDSTRDEWCEYMYTKHFSKAETLKKNGFVLEPKYERLGNFNSGTDYLDTSKSKIHKEKDSKENGMVSLESNKESSNKGESDWQVIDSDSTVLKLRHKENKQTFEITDSDIISDHSLTLQEKITKQVSRRL